MKKWEVKKLGNRECFEILGSGIAYFEGEKEYLSTSSIEANKIISIESKITYQNRPSRANMQPRLNSVWFARMINTVKVYSFTEGNKNEIERYVLSTGYAGILCNTRKVIPKYVEKIFLSEWFNNFKNALASDKAIQKSINNDDLQNLPIPIPPLSLQQKIVKILDTVQEGIEIQGRIIDKTKELKKSLMAELFRYGAPSFRKARKLKKTEIGEIPEDWEVVRLGEVAKIDYGIQSAVSGLKDSSLGIPILTNKNITNEGEIDLTELNYYPLKNEELEKYLLKKGDIIFNWRSGSIEHVGKASIFDRDEQFTFSSFILRFRINQNILNALFLKNYFFWSRNIGFLRTFSQQASINQSLNASIMKPFPIPLPSLQEQKEIAEILKVVDEKIGVEKKKKEIYEELFKSLLNKIMSWKLDVERIEV
ncbi:MAG: restriction endonuclease subunit S [Candidatus Omnitrophica bacterium]|nr:restriction endonuclease subunit S [Candidatus Omnitrophota bacterium]